MMNRSVKQIDRIAQALENVKTSILELKCLMLEFNGPISFMTDLPEMLNMEARRECHSVYLKALLNAAAFEIIREGNPITLVDPVDRD